MPSIKVDNTECSINTEAMVATLRGLRDAAPEIRRRAGRRGGEALVGEAQFDAPVKTGALKESHVMDASNPDAVRIGANTTYAAAVHARHPTKAGWFLSAIVRNGPRIMKAALAEALEHAARQVKKAGS